MTSAVVLAAVAAAAWGATGWLTQNGPEAQPPAPGVVATVNSQPITEAEWVARTRRVRPSDFAIAGRPGQLRDVPAGQVALEHLIFARLLLQYAQRTDLLASSKSVEDAVAAAKKDPGIARSLADGLIDDAALHEDLRYQVTLVNVASINERVTPDEVQAQYRRVYLDPKRWSVAAIRVTGKAKADQVLAELKKGTAFADLAARFSEDAATRARGGEIGTVLSTDPSINPAIKQALAGLKPGETTQALPASAAGAEPAAFMVLKLLADLTPKPPAFEQVQAAMERMAVLTKATSQATVQKKIDEFRKQSRIEVYVKGYEGLSTK